MPDPTMPDDQSPSRRETETADPRFRGLETWTRRETLRTLLEGQARAVEAVSAALPLIEAAVEAAVERLRDEESRLVYAGAGTSGRIAMLDGVELNPTFGWPHERARFLLAGGAAGLTQAQEGAEDDRQAAMRAVAEVAVTVKDVVIGLAASGSTPYTCAAIEASRARGALTVGFANNPGAPLLALVDHGVVLRTGPEVLAGSTRMAAGTSQKIALNLFSTAAMIGLGKVFAGQMVDMRATNRKLRARAETMLTEIAGCSPEEARRALAEAGGNVKLAVLVIAGRSLGEAERLLAGAGGDLGQALAASTQAGRPAGA